MKARHRYGISLTPLIDVVFILLAFLLVYSNMDVSKALEIALPQVEGQASETTPDALNLTLDKTGKLYLGGVNLSAEDAAKTLSGLASRINNREVILLVRSDRDARAEDLVKLMLLLSSCGILNADVAVETP